MHKESVGALRYGVILFLSAFLLFSVQLILGKYFLPWFGGTPAMWTTCMFFFQVLLLAGYAYAHALARFSNRTQAVVHCGILLASLVMLISLADAWRSPLLPDVSWRPHGVDHPAWAIVILLAVSAGLPYFVLSATSPLLQSWFTKTHPGLNPYRLYAISNLGSFMALVGYPFLFEPWLRLRHQAIAWSVAFLTFVAACVFAAAMLARNATVLDTKQRDRSKSKPKAGDYVLWVALATCASTLFLATTNQICQDIAVIPFLWVLPLSIYLLTFVICFEKPAWYSREAFCFAFAAIIVGICFVLNGGALKNIVAQVLIYSVTLFVCCMILHGELARSKPDAAHLTAFYLMISLGGALGGVFVALIAPRIFKNFWEYPLALWASALLLLVTLLRDKQSWLYRAKFGLLGLALYVAALPAAVTAASDSHISFAALIPVFAVFIGVTIVSRMQSSNHDRMRVAPLYAAVALTVFGLILLIGASTQSTRASMMARNFYGALAVQEVSSADPEWHAYSLSHGRVSHGFEFTSEEKKDVPTSYFGPQSGVAQALRAARLHKSPLRIGVIGLGVGTLAAYAQPNDYLRFYEINPNVIAMASDSRFFNYLKDCRGIYELVEGDARIALETELSEGREQRFDLLTLDAFNGDAPPVHLLTEQAFRIYLRHITAQGIIAVNITNTYLDLRGPVSKIAERLSLHEVLVHADGDDRTTKYNDWIILTREADALKSLSGTKPIVSERATLWTDDYSNLFQALRK